MLSETVGVPALEIDSASFFSAKLQIGSQQHANAKLEVHTQGLPGVSVPFCWYVAFVGRAEEKSPGPVATIELRTHS